MKLNILLSILALVLIASVFSQNTLEFSFTAVNNGQYVPLDSILVENLSQGGDTTLYAPDTVLVLDYVTSIDDDEVIGESNFSVSHNYPNPFKEQTSILLNLPETEQIEITLRDILGRVLEGFNITLSRGNHSFTFYPGNEIYYLLTVTGKQKSQTIKMIHAASNTSNRNKNKLVYNGNIGNVSGFKSQKAINDFPFVIGDTMRYTGFAQTLNGLLGNGVIDDAPQSSEIYEFDITAADVPLVETGSVSNITINSADIEGEIIDNGGSDIIQHGHCWSTETNPTVDDSKTELGATGIGTFTSTLSELEPETTYYLKAYAINSYGTAYGEEVGFETEAGSCPSTLTDMDGNIYNTVLIGDQCWMAENLKTTTYNNGIAIPNVPDTIAWSNLSSGAYVWYDNDSGWKESYGALYNWFTTIDANGLCPSGWHVPTNDEWTDLTDYIGGTDSPHGNELKSCRQVNSPLGGSCNTSVHPRWNEDTSNGNYGTDNYGFSALPGGFRYSNGTFVNMGLHGNWWSTTVYFSYAYPRSLSWHYGSVGDYSNDKRYGYSIRCLKD